MSFKTFPLIQVPLQLGHKKRISRVLSHCFVECKIGFVLISQPSRLSRFSKVFKSLKILTNSGRSSKSATKLSKAPSIAHSQAHSVSQIVSVIPFFSLIIDSLHCLGYVHSFTIYLIPISLSFSLFIYLFDFYLSLYLVAYNPCRHQGTTPWCQRSQHPRASSPQDSRR